MPSVEVDHVAIAVQSIRSALGVLELLYDLDLVYGTDDDERAIRTIQFGVDGGVKIELMEPTSADSPLAHHLDRRGEGFHHLTLKVDDVLQVIDDLTAIGVHTVGTDTSNPVWRETYTHPATCHGVLLQIAETNRDWRRPFPGLTVDDVLAGKLVWTGSGVVWRDPGRAGDVTWPPGAQRGSS